MKVTLISTNTYPGDQGLRTLSACLKREGHNVKMIFLPLSEDYSKLYSDEVLNQVEREASGSGLIGIAGMESTTKRARQVIDMFQVRNIPVVFGGPHVTFFPEKCFTYCNIICIGEAEEPIVELAAKLGRRDDITKIKNLWIRQDGGEYKNEVRPPIQNLDLLAHPDYDIADHLILENGKLVSFEERHIGGMIFFQTERGCPQACSYCTNNILRALYKGKSDLLRTHSVDYVIEEFKRLKENFPSIGVIDVRDETFLIRDIKWIREFSEKYRKEIGIRFKCLAEPASMGVEALTEEKLQLLVDAGLTDIIVGIQSGSDELNFKVYNRFISAKQVIKAAKNVNKFKDRLTVMYDIITCNPYETKEDILATINLLREIPKPYYLSVNNLIFFEGTPLYERALKDGFIKSDKDSAANLNYWDRWKHIKLKKKNAYLNLILNLMRGPVTERRYGIIPKFMLNILINDKIVNFNLRYVAPTYFIGHIVQMADYFRESIAKPIYRSMPTSFKLWYDQVRYKA